MVSKLEYLREYGLWKSSKLYVSLKYDRVITHIFRKRLRPSLDLLSNASMISSTSSEDIIESIFQASPQELTSLKHEYDQLADILKMRYHDLKMAFPINFAMGESSSFLIYAAVRIGKPEILVETGVANGQSTYFILNALKQNGSGHLTSFDVSQKAGILLSDSDREGWELVLLRKNYKAEFAGKIERLPLIDFFLHDSDHSYKWQKFEYTTIFQRLKENSIFMSDDIDSSYAFADFCGHNRIKPMILVESTKVLGCFKR